MIEDIERRLRKVASSAEDHRRRFIRECEIELDRQGGRCSLRDRRLARVVFDALRYSNGNGHVMISWCVMPNHVHALFYLERGDDLEHLLHSWKSYTAKECNRLLGVRGRFWQRDYFDRVVRTPVQLEHVIRYIRNNPRKGGLIDWPFVSFDPDWESAVIALRDKRG